MNKILEDNGVFKCLDILFLHRYLKYLRTPFLFDGGTVMSRLNEIFGSNVFNDSVMKERLPKATYKALKKTIEDGKELELSVAEVVASAMKDWAIEKGATHFTHWFQPMTGITAEKHDAFINPTGNGEVILEFSGKELIKDIQHGIVHHLLL